MYGEAFCGCGRRLEGDLVWGACLVRCGGGRVLMLDLKKAGLGILDGNLGT